MVPWITFKNESNESTLAMVFICLFPLPFVPYIYIYMSLTPWKYDVKIFVGISLWPVLVLKGYLIYNIVEEGEENGMYIFLSYVSLCQFVC